MKILPWLTLLVTASAGWALGKQVDRFTGSILAIVAGCLGFYYARRYLKQLLS